MTPSAAPAAQLPKAQATRLALGHCWLHWQAGLVLLGPCVVAGFILNLLFKGPAPATLGEAAGIMVAFYLFLGVPALVFGLVRVPLMRGLFRRPPGSVRKLLLHTTGIFLRPVALLVPCVFIDQLDNGQGRDTGFRLLVLLAPGLPWLAGSLWAARRLWPSVLAARNVVSQPVREPGSYSAKRTLLRAPRPLQHGAAHRLRPGLRAPGAVSWRSWPNASDIILFPRYPQKAEF